VVLLAQALVLHPLASRVARWGGNPHA
jgi:hypothetical protein